MFDWLKRITFSVHEVLYVVVFGNMQPGPTAPHVQAIITTPLVVVSRDIYIYIYIRMPYIWLINTSSTTSISYIQLSKLRAALYESIDRPDIMAFVGKMNEITSTTGTGPKRILVWPVQLIQLLLLRRQSGRQTAPMKKSFSSSYKHRSPLLPSSSFSSSSTLPPPHLSHLYRSTSRGHLQQDPSTSLFVTR